jgi:hypothetical protein
MKNFIAKMEIISKKTNVFSKKSHKMRLKNSKTHKYPSCVYYSAFSCQLALETDFMRNLVETNPHR